MNDPCGTPEDNYLETRKRLLSEEARLIRDFLCDNNVRCGAVSSCADSSFGLFKRKEIELIISPKKWIPSFMQIRKIRHLGKSLSSMMSDDCRVIIVYKKRVIYSVFKSYIPHHSNYKGYLTIDGVVNTINLI